jgi:hypothetical protein
MTYARFADFTSYQVFILGFFTKHVTAIVAEIALAQLLIALLIAYRGRAVYWGLAGAIADLVALAPLGSASAFPATLIAACGAVLLLRQRYPSNLPAELAGLFGYHRHATV